MDSNSQSGMESTGLTPYRRERRRMKRVRIGILAENGREFDAIVDERERVGK